MVTVLLYIIAYFIIVIMIMIALKKISYVCHVLDTEFYVKGKYDLIRFDDEEDRKLTVYVTSMFFPVIITALIFVLPFWGVSKLYDNIDFEKSNLNQNE